MDYRICRGVASFVLCFILFSWTQAHAVYLKQWQWLSPLPQGNALNSVTSDNNIIVAVGNCGAILTSSDGINWTLRASPTSKDLKGVAYGNNTFVAVGSGVILTSQNGITWTAQSNSSELNNITYGNNTFAATIDYSGVILTSPDGVSWTERNVGGGITNFFSVTWHNSTFYALGSFNCTGWCNVDPNVYVYSSLDGVTWTERSPNTQPSLLSAVWGNGVYLKISDYALGVVVSSNGIQWTDAASPQPLYGVTGSLKKICFAKGIFTVVGLYGYIATTPDGNNWTLVTSRPWQPVRGIAYGNGVWVAAGGTAISTSSDGVSWTLQYATGDTDQKLNSVAYGNNKFVAVGTSKNILTSPDGRNWTQQTTSSDKSDLSDIVFGNGVFVCVATGNGSGTVLTSPDGVNWTPGSLGSTSLYAPRITFGNGIFAAISQIETNKVYTSSDGVTWVERSFSPSETIHDITYGNNVFVIVGNWGKIYRSTDGVNWLSTLTADGYHLMSVAYGENVFVAVGDWRTIYSSTDGMTWIRRKPASYHSESLTSVAYVNHTFIASSEVGDVLQSTQDDFLKTFSFTDQTGVALNAAITSNTVTVSGIAAGSPISIVGGTYSINGTLYRAASGTINNNDTLSVRVTSANSNNATTAATVLINGEPSVFSVTTTSSSTGLSESSGGGGGCFIATAAFGSAMERHVQILRHFRDRYLMNYELGRKFVHLYYRLSPPIAVMIAENEMLRMITRWCLMPIFGVAYLFMTFGLVPAGLFLMVCCLMPVILIRKRGGISIEQ